MTTELAIIKRENIQTIVSAAPQSYQDNVLSCQRCVDAGETILMAIAEGGMTDELDQQAAAFIEKARRTVRKMNERRSPVTKLFDDIRREFTVLENTIDPTRVDTVPYKLQALRNQYAARKRAEEERKRREAMERQQAEAARARYAREVEDDLKSQLSRLINAAINNLTEKYDGVTLENYDETLRLVRETSAELPHEWLTQLRPYVARTPGVPVAELVEIEKSTKERLSEQFAEQYLTEVGDNKDYILDHLPSKKANLERIAQANAAEAARLKAEMEERRRKEAAEQEAERRRKEEEERRKAEMEKQQAEMDDLFNSQAAVAAAAYQPKMKVTQKINLLNPEGIMPVISMWWSKEGCRLSVEELAKMFKKQVTFCEKLANKDGVFISDESVEYVDDVKAK